MEAWGDWKFWVLDIVVTLWIMRKIWVGNKLKEILQFADMMRRRMDHQDDEIRQLKTMLKDLHAKYIKE